MIFKIIYLIYIWSGLVSLALSYFILRDEIFWKMARKYLTWAENTQMRTRVMVVGSLFPIMNTAQAAVLVILFVAIWLYPDCWY